MSHRLTQKEMVCRQLRSDGYVDNFWAINNKVSLRLGAIIFQLKEEGWEFDEARSGFVPGTKNWRYYLSRTMVDSRTIAGKKYGVFRIPDGTWICDCPGYRFNKTCHHVEKAKKLREQPQSV